MGSKTSKIDLEKGTSESNKLTITIIVLFLILTGIYLGIIFGVVKKDKVDYNDCNQPQGEFAVEPGISYEGVVTGCDIQDTKGPNTNCSFTAETLSYAINLCNQQSEKCNRFTYNPGEKTMKFVHLGASSASEPSENSYTRQTNITYKTKGPTIQKSQTFS